MLRQIHSLPGILAGLLLMLLAVTGAILAVEPVRERIGSPVVRGGDTDIATFAGRLRAQYAEIDKIRQTPSGSIVVTFFEGEKAGANIVDPQTLEVLGAHRPAGFTRIITNLHRTLLLGNDGRIAVGIGAGLMLVLTVSGIMMLAARLGGYRALLRPLRGTAVQRWHGELGRLAMAGLLITSLSGSYLSLATFEILPDGSSQTSPSVSGNGGPRRPVQDIEALQGVDLRDMRELSFPYSSDLTDTYTLTTAKGVTQIDAETGNALSFEPHSTARQIHEFIFMLHTGQGFWQLGLWLGLCALAVPVLSVTGYIVWWKRRGGRARIANNASAKAAETIILVGSEGNTTWGFASTLHAALVAAGQRVHTAPMNALMTIYPKAQRMIILAATYGDGDAPASAKDFMAKLEKHETRLPVAVLGFGDRSFPKFCRYAHAVSAALDTRGHPKVLDAFLIDRQSAQDFANWGARLGEALGCPLPLRHIAERAPVTQFTLQSRKDYGADLQAATAILRFGLSGDTNGGARSWWSRHHRLPHFAAGDLVGVLPPGSDLPRFYSLASGSAENFLEVCVRKQPGGLCSGFLHDLQPGDSIEAFIRANPRFRPSPGTAPLILVGAGAGIAPLMGFIRANASNRPMHLYWGGRSPDTDFLYSEELKACLRDKRLSQLHAVFSRVAHGRYVQSEVLAQAAVIGALLKEGAQIMVCGGRDMGEQVARAFDAILRHAGLDLETLREQGRYCEDIY